MISRIILTLAVATFTHGGLSGAFDWPQWQGQDRTALSKETGLLKEWPKDGPPLAWKVKSLGGGDSTPSVVGGRIYGMSHRGADEVVWALLRASVTSKRLVNSHRQLNVVRHGNRRLNQTATTASLPGRL